MRRQYNDRSDSHFCIVLLTVYYLCSLCLPCLYILDRMIHRAKYCNCKEHRRIFEPVKIWRAENLLRGNRSQVLDLYIGE